MTFPFNKILHFMVLNTCCSKISSLQTATLLNKIYFKKKMLSQDEAFTTLRTISNVKYAQFVKYVDSSTAAPTTKSLNQPCRKPL